MNEGELGILHRGELEGTTFQKNSKTARTLLVIGNPCDDFNGRTRRTNLRKI